MYAWYVLVVLEFAFLLGFEQRVNGKTLNENERFERYNGTQLQMSFNEAYQSTFVQNNQYSQERQIQTKDIMNTNIIVKKENRKLRQNYYHVITNDDELGYGNPEATLGNPMRGLIPSPRYLPPKEWENNPLSSSVEFYYIGWDEIMLQDPDFVAQEVAYNWTALEVILNDTASRFSHVAFRLFIHFPGQPLRLPAFLSDITMRTVQTGDQDNPRTEMSPYYGDQRLVRVLGQFIKELGRKYDGDTRIAAIQLGLLGFWGEWQTCCNNDDVDVLPDSVRDKVIGWYAAAFTKTQLQMRYENPKSGYINKFGRHDDSFAYKTIDGESYFFWPRTQAAGQEDFWKWGVMGGETRPELQPIIFENWYPAGSPHKQDFMECVETTHATYVFHHGGFIEGGYKGDELQKALYAHARMGYRFRIVQVAAESEDDLVNIDVVIRQVGVAPFYYPLSIALQCPLLKSPRLVSGVDGLIDKDQNKTFKFRNIPNRRACLQNVTFSLKSKYIYNERPMKFSQGPRGIVSVSIPTAPTNNLCSTQCKTWNGLEGFIVSIYFQSGCREFCVSERWRRILQLLKWRCGHCNLLS
jgi:hypothetical protein